LIERKFIKNAWASLKTLINITKQRRWIWCFSCLLLSTLLRFIELLQLNSVTLCLLVSVVLVVNPLLNLLPTLLISKSTLLKLPRVTTTSNGVMISKRIFSFLVVAKINLLCSHSLTHRFYSNHSLKTSTTFWILVKSLICIITKILEPFTKQLRTKRRMTPISNRSSNLTLLLCIIIHRLLERMSTVC